MINGRKYLVDGWCLLSRGYHEVPLLCSIMERDHQRDARKSRWGPQSDDEPATQDRPPHMNDGMASRKRERSPPPPVRNRSPSSSRRNDSGSGSYRDDYGRYRDRERRDSNRSSGFRDGDGRHDYGSRSYGNDDSRLQGNGRHTIESVPRDFESFLCRWQRRKVGRLGWDLRPEQLPSGNPSIFLTGPPSSGSAAFHNDGMDAAEFVRFHRPQPAPPPPPPPPPVQKDNSQRALRRLYVGALPSWTSSQELQSVIERAISSLHLFSCIDSEDDRQQPWVTYVDMHADKNFAFVEFRNGAQAAVAMSLDGMHFGDVKLRFRRPTEFAEVASLAPSIDVPPCPSIVSTQVQQHDPDRLFIGGIASDVPETALEEVLSSIGPLRGFHVVRDTKTNNPRGFAFALYSNPDDVDRAVEGLDGFELSGKRLDVHRADEGASTTSHSGANRPSGPAGSRVPDVTDVDLTKYLDSTKLPQQFTLQSVSIPQLRPAHVLQHVVDPWSHLSQASVSDKKTRFLCIVNLLDAEDLASAESYQAIQDEILQGLRTISNDQRLGVLIPRNEALTVLGERQSIEKIKASGDTGDLDPFAEVELSMFFPAVYVSCSSDDRASAALTALRDYRFNGHCPIAWYIPEHVFEDRRHRESSV